YSMLRTRLLEKDYRILIEAYDRRWYLDPQECWESYDAGWIGRYLDELDQALENSRRQYMNLIGRAEIERIVLKEAHKFYQYMSLLARYAMQIMIEFPEWRDLAKGDELEVRVGELLDLSEIVYKEDRRNKDPEEIKDWLEEKEAYVYAYEVFSGLNLACGDYQGIDLRYADLRGSDLSNSNLCETSLVGTRFNNGRLEKADLTRSVVCEADFSKASLRGAAFVGVEGAVGRAQQEENDWERPGFFALNFSGADLSGADFRQADLRGAIFTGARLDEANFWGARLDKAVFSRNDGANIRLDETQRASVVWT
ncbi:MAG TPA: pentapeptide repeat-containing protein, partial [Bacillota bacterium]|nr:pentapeptide repeat-containing protein [Bacillota bacterium]